MTVVPKAAVVSHTVGATFGEDSWSVGTRGSWEGNRANAVQVHCLLELTRRRELDINIALMMSLEYH